jgi:Carboxypeptidase regulatory-like domain
MMRAFSQLIRTVGASIARCATVFLAFSCLFISTSWAQERGASFNGTVTDQTGALMTGAIVTAKEVNTGQTRSTTTSSGSYSMPLLPPGTYTLTCSNPGFSTEVHSNLTLTVDQFATIDCSLKVGEVSQSVEVGSTTEQLNTVNGEIGSTINEKAIVELPLNGRNPATLVFLTPGAIDGLKAGVFTRQDYTTFPAESGASANGGRQGSTYYMLDGGNNMDNYGNLALAFPNPDATQEFNVISNNFDAQYGFSPGAVVSIQTRSGSNAWHGDLFEFLRNDALNARDFFAHSVDGLKRNQFGGSIGGRILRDKLFIFGNYQGTIERQVVNGSNTNVPSNAMLQGNFSAYLTGQTTNACGAGGPSNLTFDTGQVFDPNSARFFTCPGGSANAGQQVVVKTPYPGNQIPTSLFDPVSLKFVSTFPKTDQPKGLVNLAGRASSQNYQEFTIRPDWYLNEHHHISGRVFYDNFSHPYFTGGGNTLISDRSWSAPFQNYGGDWVWTIKPSLINNLVVAYNRLNSFSEPGLRTSSGGPVCYSCFGVNVAEPKTTPPGIDALWVDTLSIGQNTNLINRNNVSISESITWNHDKHMIVAGVNVLRAYWEEGTDWLALPIITFSGQFTGVDFADFLLGKANMFEQGAGEYNEVKAQSWAGFLQDTYKLSPNLTINVGARWEPFIAPHPTLGRIAVFEPGKQSTRYPEAPVGLVYPGDPGVPSNGAPNSIGVLSPRVSLAYQPKFLPNTVIRSAFGMFAAPFEMSFYNHAADTAPFSPTYNITPTTTGGPVVPGGTPIPFDDPWSVYAYTGNKSPFPPFASPNFAPPGNTAFIPPVFVQASFVPDFKIGRVMSWNLSVEHQFSGNIIAKAAYVGSESYHLPTPIDLNPGLYSTNPNLNGLRAYADFSSVLAYGSWTTASYNALQLSFEKRFSHGLQFSVNYTYSKTMDTATSASLAFNGSVPDPFNLNFNRGPSGLNFPNVFNVYGVYQTPDLNGSNRFVRAVFGTWQVSGVFHMQSGDPLSIAGGNGNDNSQSHIGGDRADYLGGPLDREQGSQSDWLNHYFNTAAFVTNAPGTFGNSGKNILEGPGVTNLDLALMKNFQIRERFRLQFRWEAFNALNHPIFADPDTNVTDGGFGQITNTKGYGNEQAFFGYGARVMQLALKLNF